MIRVGYPASLRPELLKVMPPGVELVPLPDGLDREIEVEVWIPDPYTIRALRIWPFLRGVRLVLSLMAGTEWIPATVGPHVTVCNAHGAHNISTAEWTISAILAMLKQFPLFFDIQRAGEWKRRREAARLYQQNSGDAGDLHPEVMVEELTGKSVLLVGYGAIGKEIERMLAPFHVELVRVARTARSEPVAHSGDELDRLIPTANIIILILPLTNASRGMIGPRQFSLMRQGALLVNAARGALVQTEALVEALKAGKIRAAFDVTDPEPLPPGHALWDCPNLLITPHVAASSPQFAPRALEVAAGELNRYLAGEPLQNVVQAAE